VFNGKRRGVDDDKKEVFVVFLFNNLLFGQTTFDS
jgi:hypothetical protein